ncbi:MAG: MFS transporter [Promethearchaeota archaeon]
MGGVPGSFYGAFTGQIQAFYIAWMFLTPGWIFIAQIFYGIWNVVNDPIFGHLQDNTKTKSGRFIPWIKWCAPAFTISFVLLFMVPDNWRFASPDDNFPPEQFMLFLYYLFTLMLHDTFFTISGCAHVALLSQMTMNPGERTKIAVYTIVASSLGYSMMGLPILLLADPNQSNIDFLRLLVIILAVITLIPWIFVVKFVKERPEFIPESKRSIKEDFTNVFKNPSGRMYMIYDGISVGIFQFFMICLPFAFSWLFGLNSEYAKINPNWKEINVIMLFIPGIICAIIGVKIQTILTKKRDIKTTLTFSMTMEAIGFFIAFLGCIPDASQGPIISSRLWLFSIGFAIAMLGFTGDLIYHNVMRADTIDYDEYLTGERSESSYAGVGCIFSKPMISVAAAMVAMIISSTGLRAYDGTEVSTTLFWYEGYSNAVIGVAVAMFLCPAILAVIGVICWQWYPLDRKVLEKLRSDLEVLHAKKSAERLSEDGTSRFISKKL